MALDLERGVPPPGFSRQRRRRRGTPPKPQNKGYPIESGKIKGEGGGVLQIANFGHFSKKEINEKSRNFRNRDLARFWKKSREGGSRISAIFQINEKSRNTCHGAYTSSCSHDRSSKMFDVFSW